MQGVAMEAVHERPDDGLMDVMVVQIGHNGRLEPRSALEDAGWWEQSMQRLLATVWHRKDYRHQGEVQFAGSRGAFVTALQEL